MDGKAIVVCMSRRIAVDLYNALIKLQPELQVETLKVVMTGSAEAGPSAQKTRRRPQGGPLRVFENLLEGLGQKFGGNRAAVFGDFFDHGFVQPDIHGGGVGGVAGVMEFLGRLLAGGQTVKAGFVYREIILFRREETPEQGFASAAR